MPIRTVLHVRLTEAHDILCELYADTFRDVFNYEDCESETLDSDVTTASVGKTVSCETALHEWIVVWVTARNSNLRLQFCWWLLCRIVLWWDDIQKEWGKQSPHCMSWMGTAWHSSVQWRFSVNIWAGIIHSYLIELYVIGNALGGIQYDEFLERTLSLLLEDVLLDTLKPSG
jgi:hypothetical protein